MTGVDWTVAVAAPTAAAAAVNVLAGRQVFAASTATTTLITVPAGRVWQGTVGASVSCSVAAASAVAGQARALFSTAGAGVSPVAGVYFGVDAQAGANAASGTTGSQAANFGFMALTVVAPAQNAVTVQVASTNAGTSSLVDAFASGVLS